MLVFLALLSLFVSQSTGATAEPFIILNAAQRAQPPPRRPRVAASIIAVRAEAALLGSFVADAAAMPLHWDYDASNIKRLVGDGDAGFYDPPENIWYNGVKGGGTPYGQQAMAYLRVGASTGGFAPADIETAYYAIYGPGCPGPTGGVYLDASTKEFVANVAQGKHYPNSGGDDTQADAVAHMVSVVALFAGNTSAMLDALEPVIRVTQNADGAVAFGCAGARFLEKLLTENTTAIDAATDTATDLLNPIRVHPLPYDADLAADIFAALAAAKSGLDAVSYFGRLGHSSQSCDFPFTLPNVVFLAASVGDGVDDGFLAGARASILAGGDSGSRGVFFGAIAGARLGDKALLPTSWTTKTSSFATIAPLITQLVAHRSIA